MDKLSRNNDGTNKQIYLEIRIGCDSQEEKEKLAEKLDAQVKELGLKRRADLIRQAIELDALGQLLIISKKITIDQVAIHKLKEILGDKIKVTTIPPSSQVKGFNPFEAGMSPLIGSEQGNYNNLVSAITNPLDEAVKKYGFKDRNEMAKLVFQVNLEDSDTLSEFTVWKETDYSKAGLLKVIENDLLRQKNKKGEGT